MRGAVCILLSFMLLFTLSTLEMPADPRASAWWGLLFPQMFARPDGAEQVTFVWPMVTRIVRWFGLNG